MFEAIFSNSQLMKMIYSILFWVILYIIVKAITVRSGIGTNLLGQYLKFLPKFSSAVSDLKRCCRGKSFKEEKVLKALTQVIRKHKILDKILDMYLFDDKSDMDVLAAKKLTAQVPDICRNIVSSVSDGDNEGILAMFDEIDSDLKQAKILVEKAIKIDLKKKMLQI